MSKKVLTYHSLRYKGLQTWCQETFNN